MKALGLKKGGLSVITSIERSLKSFKRRQKVHVFMEELSKTQHNKPTIFCMVFKLCKPPARIPQNTLPIPCLRYSWETWKQYLMLTLNSGESKGLCELSFCRLVSGFELQLWGYLWIFQKALQKQFKAKPDLLKFQSFVSQTRNNTYFQTTQQYNVYFIQQDFFILKH